MYAHREITDPREVLDLVRYAHAIRRPEVPQIEELLVRDLAEGRRLFGVYAEDRLVACWLLHPFTMRLRAGLVNMGGIGMVSSRSDVRGQGSVRFMLARSLETMREAGQVVSVLYPFNIGFYRKYGWELFTQARRYEISPGLLEIPDDASLHWEVSELQYPDEEAKTFYNRYARSHYTFVQREDPQWRAALHLWDDHVARGVVKVTQAGRVQGLLGYTLYRKPDKESPILNARLFAYETEDAKREMLRYLKRQSQQTPSLELLTAMDETLWPYLSDYPGQHKVVDQAMIRIVSLDRLDDLPAEGPDMEVEVDVADAQAPWNAGVWALRVSEGALHVARGKKPLLHCGIGPLSAVLSGFTSFQEQIAARRAEVLPGYRGQDVPKLVTHLVDGF